jgi:GNAT superfamily N-acetyltransferase
MSLSGIETADADTRDIEGIAALHVESWRATYRGMLPEAFLAGPVIADRLELWRKRLTSPRREHQLVRKAVRGGLVVGFVCVLIANELEQGALLDNLHVKPELTGGGLGRQLLEEALTWARASLRQFSGTATPVMHLWVLEGNVRARRFYERAGGTATEQRVCEVAQGIVAPEVRYVWA